MTAAADATAPTFSIRTMAALIVVGVLAFCGFLVLSAYAPDLRTGDGDPGAHALSRSAVGFAALERLLREDGVPTVISRSEQPPTRGLWVLTSGGDVDALRRLADSRRGPVLVVLPKWSGAAHPTRPGWVRTGATVAPGSIDGLLAVLALERSDRTATVDEGGRVTVNGDEKVEVGQSQTMVRRRPGAAPVALASAGTVFSTDSRLSFTRVAQLQSLQTDLLEPVLRAPDGTIVLGRLPAPRANVFVLSDPDLLNTQGVRNLNDARDAVLLLRTLAEDGGVTFDVTLHGYQRGRTLLRAAFEPPFLAATLCFVAASLLMGAHAAVRFGPAARAGRVFALGKTALADNAAGLIALAGREARFLPAYAADTRAAVARSVGAPRDLGPEQLDAFLDRIGQTLKVAEPWTALNAAAQSANGTADVADVARRLHRWRSEMTVGRS